MLRGVKNLEPISRAPNLAELLVVDMPQLQVESFFPFVGHHALRAASVGTGSQKKNRAIADLLSLPSTGYPGKWVFQFVES
jgi:hypothetical protein